MSMYAELLVAALGDHRWSDGEPPTGALLAKLLRYRSRLILPISSPTGPHPAPAAVADQLAYDATLIDLARRLGIDCDVHGFAQPLYARARIERALASRGLRLDELERQHHSAPEER